MVKLLAFLEKSSLRMFPTTPTNTGCRISNHFCGRVLLLHKILPNSSTFLSWTRTIAKCCGTKFSTDGAIPGFCTLRSFSTPSPLLFKDGIRQVQTVPTWVSLNILAFQILQRSPMAPRIQMLRRIHGLLALSIHAHILLSPSCKHRSLYNYRC